MEQVEKWARYVKEHPNKWKKELKLFVDSQIIIANRFYKKLNETEEGRKKLVKIMELKC